MSDEIKNNNADEAKVETVADKLNSAAQTLEDANAEAKLRREEEKKQQALLEKEEKARLEEEEKRREEDEKRNQATIRKKQAELDYAESYRKKLREDKDRAQLLAAQRRAAKRAAEEERKKKEADELARKEAEDAARRNAESDTLVDKMSAKAKENEKAQAELDAKRKEAREKAEAEANAALLRRLESSKNSGPIIITADGLELFPGSDGYEEALAMGARVKEEDEGPTLASEEMLRAIQAKLAARDEDKKDKEDAPEDEPAAEPAPEAEPDAADAEEDVMNWLKELGFIKK